MKVALVGKPGLVADIGDIIPGPQARFGELNPRDIDKAGGRQAGILLEGADQRLFAQRNSSARLSSVGGACRLVARRLNKRALV
ncbi:Uncharacterised protein [Klebsiella michiganensis]|nr:Uncharacterised protein [Klebsiella michiganensis]